MRMNNFQNNSTLKKAKQRNWKLYKLTDVLVDKTRKVTKIKKGDYLESGNIPIIDQGASLIGGYSNFNDGYYDEVPFIVFGDHTRVLKYIEKPSFIGADGVKVLNVKLQDEINIKFLYYFLKSIDIPNTGYNRHFKYLKEVVIPIPTLTIQDKIVSLLDKMKNIIAKRKQQIESLSILKQSVFLDMFGDPQLNDRNWKYGKINDLTLRTNYGSSKKADDKIGEFPMLRMGNITYDGELDLSDLKYIDLEDKELDNHLVHQGELLFNRTNSKELVGKTAVYNKSHPMAFAGYLIKLITNNKSNSYFISGYLNSVYGKRFLLNMAKNSIGMSNINARELKEIPIYIPPIGLQEEYANIILKIDKKKELLEKGLEAQRLLYQSLMQKAFNGELFNG